MNKQVIEIYRHQYDNPLRGDLTKKPNELLGTFEVDLDEMDDYSFNTTGVNQKDGNTYAIKGREVSYLVDRFNAGSEIFIEPLPTPLDTEV